MFKKIKIKNSVNKAVAELDISPEDIDTTYRLGLIDIALTEDLSAYEIATLIYYKLPHGRQPYLGEQFSWVAQGKVRKKAIEDVRGYY